MGKAKSKQYGLIAIAVAAGIAVLVWWWKNPRSDPELQKLEALVSAASTACAQSTESESGAKALANLEILLEKVKAEGGVAEYRKKHVGDKDLPPELRPAENKSVRECMDRYMPGIFEAIGVKVSTGQPTVPAPDVFPLEMTLRVLLQADNPSPLLTNAPPVLGIVGSPRPKTRMERKPDGRLEGYVVTPRIGAKIEAALLPPPGVEFEVGTKTPPYTFFCLKRAPHARAGADPTVLMNCRHSQMCKDFDGLDSGWLVHDETCNPKRWARATEPQTAFAWIANAHAQDRKRIWIVPSIESLESKAVNARDGYTVFTIESRDLRSVKADGISLDLGVNDTEVRIDGMPGDMLVRVLDPKQPLKLRFALQTLNFAGTDAGCDVVTAKLRFWNGGKPVGNPIVLTRKYAALRHAKLETVSQDELTFTWSAEYKLPPKVHEWRVFFQSLDPRDKLRDVEGSLKNLETARQGINKLSLSYGDQPVVAVMRPPMEKPTSTWGLAVGLLQKDTGQIRFTFDKPEADKVMAFVRQERTSNPKLVRVSRPEPSSYTEPAGADRQAICDPK